MGIMLPAIRNSCIIEVSLIADWLVLLTCGILWDTFSAGDINSDWPSYPSARHKADSH